MKGFLLVVLVMAGAAAASLTMENGKLTVDDMLAKKKEGEQTGRFVAEKLTPEEGFTQLLHNYLEKKHTEKLARLGRKDTRAERSVIARPAEAAQAEADAMAKRGGPSGDVARPIWLDLGERGCTAAGQPCLIGLSCQDNTCVGPAKAGESCALDDSGFMCESGSYCQCTNAQRTTCTCTEEKKEGSCVYQQECTGGYVCNIDYSTDPEVGTCTAVGSVEDGGIASDDILCEYGLFYDDTTGPDNAVCTATPNTCVDDADCASTYSGYSGFATSMFSDGIYYTCSSGNCVSANPNCKSAFSGVLSVMKKETASTWGAPEGIDFNSAFYKLQKCLYADHVTDQHKGKPFPYQVDGQQSTGDFPFFSWGQWGDTTWVAHGGDCSASTARCEVGLDCRDDVCHYPNAEGESCADMGGDDRCEIGTYCYNYTTCMAPLKKGEACHWEYDSLYGYTAETQCMGGYGCNYATETVTGSKIRQDGVCTELGTVEDGESTSDEDFCAYGLFDKDEGGDFDVCRGFGADETCTRYNDCDYFNNYYIYNDYGGGDYNSDTPQYQWQFGFAVSLWHSEGQVYYCTDNVTDSRCVFNEDNKCEKAYSQFLTYLKGYDNKPQLPSWDAVACALSDCLYKDATYKGYKTCSSGAAGLLPAPLLLLVAVAMAVFFHQ